MPSFIIVGYAWQILGRGGSFCPSPPICEQTQKCPSWIGLRTYPMQRAKLVKTIFVTDDKSNTCPLCWNSFKIKRVIRSTIAAETLSLSDGCDVAMYKYVSIRIVISGCETVKHRCIHWKPTSVRCCTFIKTNPRKATIRWYVSNEKKMVEINEINFTWIDKTKQISDIFTKAEVSSNILGVNLRRWLNHKIAK